MKVKGLHEMVSAEVRALPFPAPFHTTAPLTCLVFSVQTHGQPAAVWSVIVVCVSL